MAAASLSAADLSILSEMKFATLRYGAQNASLTLMGFSTTLVITASQSAPSRS